MEEINIEFTPDIFEDIDRNQIPKKAIDFIINYEDSLVTLKELKEDEKNFIKEEFYHYADAVNRAIKAVEIIFK